MEARLNQLQAKLEADPSIVENLFGIENPEAVQALLKDQGIDFTLEEIESLRVALVKVLEKGETDELSDDDLEEVAGGFAITIAGITAIAGLIGAVAGGVGAVGKVVDSAVRSRW
jgi:predicted ribosomally synthesized peptide with nif11-like leader